jgi:integrase
LATLSASSRRTQAAALRLVSRRLWHRQKILHHRWRTLQSWDLRQLLSTFRDEGYAPATINRILAAVLGLFKTAWKMGRYSGRKYRALQDVRRVRGAPRRGRPVTREELGLMMHEALMDQQADGRRNALVLLVLFSTGLRANELLHLTVSDWRNESQSLHVRTAKGDRPRLIPVPPATTDAIRQWLQERPPVTAFDRLLGVRSYASLRRIIARYATRPMTPHDFRRAYLTELLAGGADVFTVQRLAGHSSPMTTVTYDYRENAFLDVVTQVFGTDPSQGLPKRLHWTAAKNAPCALPALCPPARPGAAGASSVALRTRTASDTPGTSSPSRPRTTR